MTTTPTTFNPERYGVVGDPINHSKSPLIHQLFAQQTKQEMQYEAIRIDAEEANFIDEVRYLQQLGFKGLNVTVPYKLDAYELADQLTPRAAVAHAVNTLVFLDNGQILGDNTDGEGLVLDIEKNAHRPFKDKTVLIIGAGGAVQGILGPLLAKHPRLVHIANRTAQRAQVLGARFNSQVTLHASGWDDIPQDAFDIIINGTSASLEGKLPPVSAKVIGPQSLVYDMMYAAEPTIFLKWAQAHQPSCQCMDGLGMLVGQAAESFKLWRGILPETQPIIQQLRQQIQPQIRF